MKKLNSTILLSILLIWLPLKADAEDLPVISSGAAIVIDAKTGEVLFEKKSMERKYPASLTKVATAIYAIEKGNLDDEVTVSATAREAEGTRVYLEEGEKVSLKKLVQGLLINSGNDAGVAIAEHLDGSVDQFAKNFNEYLDRIGAKNTNFENPHGLFSPYHVTTARDLAIITQYAMRNEEFRKIFGTTELPWNGDSWDTTLFTHHKLMRETPYDGVTGGKTGYVDESGHTLVTTAQKENISLIVVTLQGASQEVVYGDTTELLDYAFGHYKTSHIPEGTTIPIAEGVYKTKKDYYFTQPVDQKVSLRINSEGELEILNTNLERITSFRLQDLSVDRKQAGRTQDESLNIGIIEVISYTFGLVIVAFVALRTVSLVFKRKKYALRNSRQNGS